MTGQSVVRFDAVSKSYGSTVALRDLSLDVRAGEILGYLGPNGAGKTTTLRLLMGLLRADTGRVTVLGRDAWREAVQVHRQVGYLSGDPALYDRLTGLEHLAYAAQLRHDPAALAHGRALAERLDLDLGRPARHLSKGNRQKVAVVLALMSRPSLLVLDEPTSGLDPLAQNEFFALLQERTADGAAVLLSSHVLGEVQRVADRVGILRAGRLIAVEDLEALRRRSLHHVTAHLGDGVDDLAAVPGLRDVRFDHGVWTASAPQSSLDALLKAVSRHDVRDFACVEADLEETFVAYYGGQEVTGGVAH